MERGREREGERERVVEREGNAIQGQDEEKSGRREDEEGRHTLGN